jgi:predicted aspartyl protease
MTDMGTLRIDAEIENPARPGARRTIERLLVDTGSELSWILDRELEALGIRRSRRMLFRQASGQLIERWVGIAVVHVGGIATGDDVVFAEPGDLSLLGSRTLEGLNVRVDPVSKQLVDAGPAPAAARGARIGRASGRVRPTGSRNTDTSVGVSP